MIAGESQQPADGGNFKFYVGAARVSVAAMNPTPHELLQLGMITEKRYEEIKDKPHDYLDSNDGSYRLDFYLKLEEPMIENKYVKLQIRIKNEDVKPGKNTGKVKVINPTQSFAWVTEQDIANKASMLNAKGEAWYEWPYRRAQVGEEELYRLLKLITGKNKKADKIEPKIDLAQVMQGNYKTIESAIAGSEGKKNSWFKVMLGVNVNQEGKVYQQVYKTPFHLWSKEDTYERIHKELVDYLAAAQGNHFYGTQNEFRAIDFVFRSIDANDLLAKLANSPVSTQSQPVEYSSELDALGGGGSKELVLDTSAKKEDLDALPF